MATARKARTIQVGLAVAGVIAAAVTIAYVHRSSRPVQAPPPVSAPAPTAATPADGNDSASDELLPLGSVFGVNSPAPPPVSISIGPPPGAADALDLSTPAAAVYSVLSLIDEGTTDKLAACFIEETEAPGDPVCTSCRNRVMHSSAPCALIRTDPSGIFFTQPRIPLLSANRLVYNRKHTPCTLPSTFSETVFMAFPLELISFKIRTHNIISIF